MEEVLRGKQYASVKKVKTAAMKWLKVQSTEFYEAGRYALIQRWNINIQSTGDYAEK